MNRIEKPASRAVCLKHRHPPAIRTMIRVAFHLVAFMIWLERLLGLFIVGWWIAGLYGLLRAVWPLFGWPIDDINFFCAFGMALFAILVVWANVRYHRLIASVPADQREDFVRTSHHEMAIW